MTPLDPVSLGATLYLPGTRADLVNDLFGGRHAGLRSAVVCLEDSVRADHLPIALERLGALLLTLPRADGPALFLRPRDPATLAHMLRLPGIEHVDGFVIPKATADSLPVWLAALAERSGQWIMPTLETREAFDPAEMRRLRKQLIAVQERVLLVRIGGNDLLQTIGARRSAIRTAYDGPLGVTIATLVATFASWGFALSAPVLEHYGDDDLLRAEVARDLEHGLFTKSAIHPRQISVIQSAYEIDVADYREALATVDPAAPAVFAATDGRMCEPATHRRWAEHVLRRARYFGCRPELVSATG